MRNLEVASQSSALVRGEGAYVDDIQLPNTHYLKVVRSPYARAKILSVRGGINSSELRAIVASVGEGAAEGISGVPFPTFPEAYVSYLGEPVAAVVGKTRYEAEDLAESVEVEYEPLKPVVGIEQALSSEPIHPSLRDNILSRVTLGADFKLEGAPVVLRETIEMKRVAANPIEPRGILFSYDGSRLTVYASAQSIHSVKAGVSTVLGLDPGTIRVVQADTGGAFGSKGGVYPEYIIAAFASMKMKCPVKWIETRAEHLLVSHHGRGVKGEMELYADRSGVARGLKAKVYVDAGAYFSGANSTAPLFIGRQMTGPYGINNAYVEGLAVYTNKVPHGPYRGAGRPEAGLFIERMMDLLADELKMDPIDVRRVNATSGTFVSPLGESFEASRPFLDSAVKKLGLPRRGKNGVGEGFSFFVLYPAPDQGEGVKIAIRGGRVKVWLGSNPGGQGHDVFVRKMVSEKLGVPESSVDLERGDTDELEAGVGTWGSRSAMIGGAVIVDALEQLLAEAKKRLGAKGSDAKAILSTDMQASVFKKIPSNETTASLGANLVRAAVADTGQVKVLSCSSYYDVGKALNPAMVVSQVAGGAAQAIGEVLFEEVKYDEEGQLLTSSISDSGVPSAAELPSFKVLYSEHPSNLPHAVRGVGEAPTIGVPPALVRAIENASGKRITVLPVAPELLLK